MKGAAGRLDEGRGVHACAHTYVRTYPCARICTCVHRHVRAHHMRASARACIHMCTHTRVRTYTCAYTCARIQVSTHAHMHTYTQACIHMCVHMHVCAYAHARIRTCTHKHVHANTCAHVRMCVYTRTWPLTMCGSAYAFAYAFAYACAHAYTLKHACVQTRKRTMPWMPGVFPRGRPRTPSTRRVRHHQAR